MVTTNSNSGPPRLRSRKPNGLAGVSTRVLNQKAGRLLYIGRLLNGWNRRMMAGYLERELQVPVSPYAVKAWERGERTVPAGLLLVIPGDLKQMADDQLLRYAGLLRGHRVRELSS